MKLWLLKAIPNGNGLCWGGNYDTTHAFVIRAKDEIDARNIATHYEVGDEFKLHLNPWLDCELTTCIQLTEDGVAEIVCHDFFAG